MSQRDKELLLSEWFEKLEKPLMIYAFQIVHDRTEAQDLVQDAFLRFSRQEVEILEPKAWLYKTLRNLCISFLRKNNRLQRATDEDQLDFLDSMNKTVESNLVSNLEKNEAIDRVKHGISLLPDELSEIIKLKFEKQKSYEEISKATGLSPSNVGYKLHHIIKDLAQELKQEGFFK
ncbi:MAG: RNA polymerase sigma factor [Opitutae bacterium]|jgi:RNA polymerase sigma factor (sigma-70 family)|nr:RNA polymerase sigma factor [Opitutae bacterium]MBT5717230.1 RNA polymerase sigma factor [Opitutae bacterium]